MYKLFLSLRYLRSRVIAYFAVLAVALCVAMMLIVISVMNGFLDKIERAAKGLFGDVVIESASLSGVARYDEFIAELERKVPEVQSASQFILTFGILRLPGYDYRQMVQVAGIRLPEQASVTDFAEGLHFQRGLKTPTFDPPFEVLLERLRQETERTRRILQSHTDAPGPAASSGAKATELIARLRGTIANGHRPGEFVLNHARAYQRQLAEVQEALEAAEAKSPGRRTPQIEELSQRLDDLIDESGVMPPSNRIILGLGIPGLSFRTEEGQTIRFAVPGRKVSLLLAPLGRQLSDVDVSPARGVFTVIDDCRTDVSSIDSELVYVPFKTLQKLNNMGPTPIEGPGDGMTPARCSQIHVKVQDRFARGRQLRRVTEKINELWRVFEKRYPDAAGTRVEAQTWRQRQAKIIGPIQQQRTLVVTMFGIISLVAVVLIFVIFYTIVVQKTRDIGVMKAIGASSGGVAQIFLAYGAAIGLVGSILGCIGGYYFVRYINPIQDAIDRWFGFRVWSKEWFLFEKIPNEVDALTALAIALGAIAASLLGALVPAMLAARMEPVEALRYE